MMDLPSAKNNKLWRQYSEIRDKNEKGQRYQELAHVPHHEFCKRFLVIHQVRDIQHT